eukprot:756092-Hanusia_phi.AAC.2
MKIWGYPCHELFHHRWCSGKSCKAGVRVASLVDIGGWDLLLKTPGPAPKKVSSRGGWWSR